MKRFTMFVVVAAALALLAAPAWGQSCGKISSGQSLTDKAVPAPGPAPQPVDPTPRAEWIWGAEGFTKAGGSWVLICPPECPKVTTPPNHHGEVREFCDCDGDGQQDEGCAIWIRTDADRTQNLFCTQTCQDGSQCSMITVEKPDGTIYSFCDCV